MPGPLSAIIAIVVFVGYVALVALLWRANRVDYVRLAESQKTVVRGIVVPIGLGLVGLVAATTALGWWPAVLTQPRVGPLWALAVPLLWLVAGIVAAVRAELSALGGRRVATLAGATLIVGAAEELLARGILVVGAQDAGWPLASVWLFSTVLFALLHAINGLFGLTWKAAAGQLGASFLGGTALFVTLLATGSLLPGILIHALWDFAALAHQARGSKPPLATIGALLIVYLGGVAAITAMIFF